MTTISYQGAADSGTKHADASYSRGGVVLLVCAASMLGFLAASALNVSGQSGIAKANPPTAVKGRRTQHIENEVLQGVLSDIDALKKDNAALRNEVATLTEQNGILDKIIGHVRDLQGADREIHALLNAPAGAQGPSEGQGQPDPPIASLVKHEVVTPRAAKPFGAAPVPETRPADINNGEIADAKGGSPG